MSGVFLTTPSVRNVICTLVDSALISGTLAAALLLELGMHSAVTSGLLLSKMAVLTASLLLSFYYNGLYDGRSPRDRRDLFLRVVKSYMAAGILLSLVYYLVPALVLGRYVFLVHFPVSMISILLWRSFYYRAIQSDSLAENVLIIGTGEAAQDIARETLARKREGYRVVGFLGSNNKQVGQSLVNPSVIGTIDQLHVIAQNLRVDTLVVALEDRRGTLPLSELVRCKLEGIRVEEATSFYETLTGQIPVRDLNPSSLIFSQGFRKLRLLRNSRRALEFVVASTALAISLPLLVIASLLIWLDSGRPVFYRQQRVGEKGKIFNLYKLRTMRPDAESESGAVWVAAESDPRITRVGRFLRKTRIDELPQMFNVLKGEMSFVGPRPERPYFVEKLQELIPYYAERHAVKPGITGWAQVRFGYGSSVEEAEVKLRYDLYYIKHMSIWLDMMILLDTVKVVVFGRGAR